MIQSNLHPITLLHNPIIDWVWVKYCYWEPVNQTIQYYSLNHPELLSRITWHLIWDYSDFLNKTKYFRLQQFHEMIFIRLCGQRNHFISGHLDRENNILGSQKAVHAMETVFSSNIELLSEPKMVFKRKLIIHSFISKRFREFKMRREY